MAISFDDVTECYPIAEGADLTFPDGDWEFVCVTPIVNGNTGDADVAPLVLEDTA